MQWLVCLSLLLPAALACDMCKMGFNIDHSQQQQGVSANMAGNMAGNMATNMAGQQNNMAAQQQIAELQQNNKMMEQMIMMMMMEKMSKAQSWGASGSSGASGNSCPGCQGFADVVFVLDASGSIGQENFDKQLKFIGDVAARFELQQSQRKGYRVSVVSFSGAVREEFPLNKFDNITMMREAITKIDYMSSSTNTAAALEFVRDETFLASRGSREDSIKIVIVITDGRSGNPASTRARAREMHSKGWMVLSIGVGDNVDQQELKQIATSDKNVFQAASFDLLDSIKQAVEDRACTVTIEQGGAILDDLTEVQKAAYREQVEEQKRIDAERRQQMEILESFKNFEAKGKLEYEREHAEEEEKDKLEFMETSIKKAMAEMEHYEELAYMKMEMSHAYTYTVAAQMIRFCPLSSESTMTVMKFMGHGDSKWTPGDQSECNVEDLPSVNQNDDPMIVAQSLASMNRTEQIMTFFSGLKDSVCGGLHSYMRQLKTWEQQYPQFGNMMF